MATKQKGKSSKISFRDDDFLDSLFDDKKPKGRTKETRGGPYSAATDDILGMLSEEVKMDDGDTEDSDVSAADPRETLENMMDMDDMDNDIFSSKKKLKSIPAQKKPFGNERQKKDSAEFDCFVKPEDSDEPAAAGKKSNSAPSSAARNHKKFTFSESDGDDEGFDQRHHTEDLDDPLANILDELLPDESKPKSKSNIPGAKPGKSVPPPSAPPVTKTETPKTAKNRADLIFDDDDDDDDGDDLIDGFDDIKNNPKKKEATLWFSEKSEPPQRARTRLDDILDSLTAPRLSDQPPAVQRKDSPQAQEKLQAAGMKDDDLTFGTYQPTMVSTPGGRRPRRHSVRFSTEDVGSSAPEKKPKPTNPTSSRHQSSADWLGLKTNDDLSFLEDETKEIKTSAAAPEDPSSPPLERRPSLTGNQHTFAAAAADGPTPTHDITEHAKPEVSEGRRVEQVEDDWLAAALSKKKALSGPTSEAKTLKQDIALELNVQPVVSKQVTSQSLIGREDALMSYRETSTTFPGQPGPPTYSSAVRGRTHLQDCPPPVAGPPPVSAANPSHSQPQNHNLTSSKGSRVPQGSSQPLDQTVLQQNLLNPLSAVLPDSVWTPQLQNTHNPVQQVTFSADSLQQLLLQQQVLQSQLLHPGAAMSAGAMQAFKEKEVPSGEHQALQARVIQLEGQVKTLQLELEQSQMLGENLQQRHKQDMELMESAHKARVKLFEESAAQRDTQARLENEDLMERLATATRSAEQERSELQAQYKRKLTLAQEDRDKEVERLRDLQRKSILEMKKDHEDQIQRLKKLKDEEIDAVTSATSQTRSLAVVIEQMEQFSSQLGALSSRVESTHEHTAQGLEQGARHRDQQLQMMQNRLGQQQKAMGEERAYLKEIISRMDVQLNEQKRQIETERWKMTAEQAKAESTQRGLEEEQRSLSVQINIEKEELERAKSALLKEQKSVMQQCAEERRKLASEWNHFHAMEKQRHERAEQEVSSLLERKEGSIISLAQEQADLKLRAAELKQNEMAVAREREALQRLREELNSEKERVSSSALRLKTRAEEVEAFSKLAAEKHEEGEKALQEANRVESEHEARLANIHIQTERLRQQEQRMLKKQMHLNHLGKEPESLRQDPLATPLPQMTPTILPGSTLPRPELLLPMSVSTSFNDSMPLQASLPLWKYTGVKECHYLEEELNFLENLKKKSYKSTFQDRLTYKC